MIDFSMWWNYQQTTILLGIAVFFGIMILYGIGKVLEKITSPLFRK